MPLLHSWSFHINYELLVLGFVNPVPMSEVAGNIASSSDNHSIHNVKAWGSFYIQ